MSYRRKPVAGASYSSFITEKDIKRYPDEPVEITAPTDGTPGLWKELVGSGEIANEFAICGIGFQPESMDDPTWWFGIVEIAYGEPGEEKVTIEFPVMQRHQYGSKMGVMHRFIHCIEPFRKFPAGTRIVARGNHSNMPAGGLGFMTLSIVETTPDLANLTQNDILSYPPASYTEVNSGSTAWTWGDWAEVIPAGTFSTDFIVCSFIAVYPGDLSEKKTVYFDGTIQIGENEVPKITIPVRHDAVPEDWGQGILLTPEAIRILRKFSAGAKVSVRACTSLDEVIPFHVCLQAVKLPL